MISNFSIPNSINLQEDRVSCADNVLDGTKIGVIGIGGGGGNAVDNLARRDIGSVKIMAANADAQDLREVTTKRIQLGPQLTGGAGAGRDVSIGRRAAEEVEDEIRAHLSGLNLLFLVATLGGGTGSGATPVIARIAREMNILTVSFVTMPFDWDVQGKEIAIQAIDNLGPLTDTLIVGSNEKLLHLKRKGDGEGEGEGESYSLEEAFHIMNDVLAESVRSVSDLILKRGLINVDFADIKRVLHKGGRAQMASGQACGNDRVKKALDRALSTQLLENDQIIQADKILINVTGNVACDEMPIINNVIKEKMAQDRVNWGVVTDKTMQDFIRITIIASGFDNKPRNNGSAMASDDMGLSTSSPPSPFTFGDDQPSVSSPSMSMAEKPEENGAAPLVAEDAFAASSAELSSNGSFWRRLFRSKKEESKIVPPKPLQTDNRSDNRSDEEQLPLFHRMQENSVAQESRDDEEAAEKIYLQDWELKEEEMTIPSWGEHSYGKKKIMNS